MNIYSLLEKYQIQPGLEVDELRRELFIVELEKQLNSIVGDNEHLGGTNTEKSYDTYLNVFKGYVRKSLNEFFKEGK